MDSYYNNGTYLRTSDLNSIENSIEELTQDIQEIIFDNTQSPLQNIQVGDNLNSRTLYLSFPKNLSEPGISMTIVSARNSTTSKVSKIMYEYDDDVDRVYISTWVWSSSNNDYINIQENIFYKDEYVTNPSVNCVRFKLPYNFGTVTAINSSTNTYNRIKIYNDETIIPNYQKHTWVDNEPLSMQKIDNIENGLKNIGYYYYKPNGWIATEDWLKTADINHVYPHINNKYISYQDLNRWINDLSLINFEDLNNLILWNTEISKIQWNKYNDDEWEEL